MNGFRDYWELRLLDILFYSATFVEYSMKRTVIIFYIFFSSRDLG